MYEGRHGFDLDLETKRKKIKMIRLKIFDRNVIAEN